MENVTEEQPPVSAVEMLSDLKSAYQTGAPIKNILKKFNEDQDK